MAEKDVDNDCGKFSVCDADLGLLIDLTFEISPVVAGLFFIILFGRMSPIYPILQEYGMAIVFAVPGIILATVFVTFPFIIPPNDITEYQMGIGLRNNSVFSASIGRILNGQRS